MMMMNRCQPQVTANCHNLIYIIFNLNEPTICVQGTASSIHFTRVAKAARCASLPWLSPPSWRHCCILVCKIPWGNHLEVLCLTDRSQRIFNIFYITYFENNTFFFDVSFVGGRFQSQVAASWLIQDRSLSLPRCDALAPKSPVCLPAFCPAEDPQKPWPAVPAVGYKVADWLPWGSRLNIPWWSRKRDDVVLRVWNNRIRWILTSFETGCIGK